MKKLTLLFLFSILQSILHCQHDFGLKAGFGLSKLVAERHLMNPTKFIFTPSWQAGCFYNFNLNKTSLIGVELLFVQIESTEHAKFIYTDALGNPLGVDGSINTDYHLSYLSVPIYYGLKLKKLAIHLGIQAGLAVTNSAHQKTETPYNGQILRSETTGKMNIDKYDAGIKGALIYNLSKRFSVEAGYYCGVNNIMSNNAPSEWNWKIQQITLGLRYKIFTKDRK